MVLKNVPSEIIYEDTALKNSQLEVAMVVIDSTLRWQYKSHLESLRNLKMEKPPTQTSFTSYMSLKCSLYKFVLRKLYVDESPQYSYTI